MSLAAAEPALFVRLVETCDREWRAYTRQQFVLSLAGSDVPEASRHASSVMR